LAVGQRAPDFWGLDLDRRSFHLRDLRQQGGVVLAFFALRNPDAEDFLRYLQNRYLAYRRLGLEVLGIDTNYQPEQLQKFMEENELAFRIHLDTEGRVQRPYRVSDVPTVFVVDQYGKIRAHVTGFSREATQALEAAVEELRQELVSPPAGGGPGGWSPKKKPQPEPPKPRRSPKLEVAHVKYEVGDLGGALEDAQAAAQETPQDLTVQLWLGYLYERNLQLREALETYRKALGLDPTSDYARSAVARLSPYESLFPPPETPAAGTGEEPAGAGPGATPRWRGAGGAESETGEAGAAAGSVEAGPLTQIQPRWLVVGPLAPTARDDINKAHEPEKEVLKGEPNRENRYTGVDGKIISWEVSTQDYLGRSFMGQDHMVIGVPWWRQPEGTAYFYTKIISPEERAARITVHVPASCKIWLNGKNIYTQDNTKEGDRKRKVIPGSEVRVRLNQGPNPILIKIKKDEGSWNADLLLVDTEGERFTDIRYDFEAQGTVPVE